MADHSDDRGTWLFVGLCAGALFVRFVNAQARPDDMACGAECLAQADLLAQQSMAGAAWIMAVISAISLSLAFATLWFIRANLQEARRVSLIAIRTAEAAESSVAIAREVAVIQTRAYLAITSVSLAIGDHDQTLSVQYANAGQSPARRVSVVARLSARTSNAPPTDVVVGQLIVDEWEPAFDGLETSAFLGDLPAGGDTTSELHIYDMWGDIADEKFNAAETIEFLVSGAISYVDVFGSSNSEQFSYRVLFVGDFPKFDEIHELERCADPPNGHPG